MKYYEKLIYLDRDFISLRYEEENNYYVNTMISKSESINASARIPLFSGGASATETKTYSLSTTAMLKKMSKSIQDYPDFDKINIKLGGSSLICWAEGALTIHEIESSKTINGKKEITGKENFYALVNENYTLALVPTQDYWVSGVASFQGLINNVIGPIDIPVKMLARIYAAHTSFDEWMAVPLVIQEK